jgi:hypothetical protein
MPRAAFLLLEVSGHEAAIHRRDFGREEKEGQHDYNKDRNVCGAVVVAGGLVLAIRTTSTSTKDGRGTIGAPVAVAKQAGQLDQVSPFNHAASIPAIVDPSAIRFEKLRTVQLVSKTKTTTDSQKCKDLQFRDPDGSNCQTTTVEERVKAIEATYSYSGPVVSAGESIPGRDTFSVYFRPKKWVSTGRSRSRSATGPPLSSRSPPTAPWLSRR